MPSLRSFPLDTKPTHTPEILSFNAQLQIAPLLVSHVRDLVRPLVLRRKGAEDMYGTGQVLKIAGHYALVTAEHNLVHHDQYLGRKDQLCSIGISRTYEFKDDAILWLGAKPRKSVWLNTGAGVKPDGTEQPLTLDVAVVELFEDEVAWWGVETFGLDQVTPMAVDEPNMLLLVGFPGEKYDTSRFAEGVVTASYFALPAPATAVATWRETWAPSTHQVALWKPKDAVKMENGRMVKADLPNPKGISGCGMWTMIQTVGAMFNPVKQVKLAGIVCEVHLDLEAAVGCSSNVLMSAVAATFPDTEELIRSKGFAITGGTVAEQMLDHNGRLV